MRFVKTCFAIVLSLALFACNNSSHDHDANNTAEEKKPAQIIEENTSYSADTANMKGYVVYSDSFEGKRPAVLVVHEWWGQNEYSKKRAKQLAELGYIAMAVDMYGNGQTADNPDAAGKLATPFYMNQQLIKTRMDAAIAKIKTYAQTDTSKIAAIGYCYGGFVVLNGAKMGSDLDGVVSFHGNLSGAKPVKPMQTKALVCHGAADSFISQQEIDQFKKQMDSVGANYNFISYPNSKHAFTNPLADEYAQKFKLDVAYNAEADKKSWNDMKGFLAGVFK